LLAKLGEDYERLLADYRRLMRASFERAGGLEVDTQGDAFFIAFVRAKAAVNAAVEAQRDLASHPWPGGVERWLRQRR
jgi:class 3 adenylate cyclase